MVDLVCVYKGDAAASVQQNSIYLLDNSIISRW